MFCETRRYHFYALRFTSRIQSLVSEAEALVLSSAFKLNEGLQLMLPHRCAPAFVFDSLVVPGMRSRQHTVVANPLFETKDTRENGS